MLSRKYYQLIANSIKNSTDKNDLIQKLCIEFKADNYKFNADRFLKVCKGE